VAPPVVNAILAGRSPENLAATLEIGQSVTTLRDPEDFFSGSMTIEDIWSLDMDRSLAKSQYDAT
jgi:hypothetical protein